jgi:hypothetical protein
MVPYNVPGPAFDLLNRLLNHSTFMDIDLPQVRVDAFQKVLKDVERPQYHDHQHSHEHMTRHHDHDKSKVTHEMETEPIASISGDSFVGGNDSFLVGQNSHWHFAGVAVISMVLGFVLALITIRRRGTNNHSTYERLPNAVSVTL